MYPRCEVLYTPLLLCHRHGLLALEQEVLLHLDTPRGFVEALNFCCHILSIGEPDSVVASRRCMGLVHKTHLWHSLALMAMDNLPDDFPKAFISWGDFIAAGMLDCQMGNLRIVCCAEAGEFTLSPTILLRVHASRVYVCVCVHRGTKIFWVDTIQYNSILRI